MSVSDKQQIPVALNNTATFSFVELLGYKHLCLSDTFPNLHMIINNFQQPGTLTCLC